MTRESRTLVYAATAAAILAGGVLAATASENSGDALEDLDRIPYALAAAGLWVAGGTGIAVAATAVPPEAQTAEERLTLQLEAAQFEDPEAAADRILGDACRKGDQTACRNLAARAALPKSPGASSTATSGR